MYLLYYSKPEERFVKAVRTVRRIETIEARYDGNAKPQYRVGDYVRIYSGRYEGHHFFIKDVRYNHDCEKFEYLYAGPMGGWYREGSIVPAGSRQGWHYDSQGYCDNPGRDTE